MSEHPPTVRLLSIADLAKVEAFLALHADSSMFLRANVRRAGLEYEDRQFQATYVGAFRDGALVAMAAHCWNGIILLQAPVHAAEVARAVVEQSRREITGLSGPREQVHAAREALGFADRPTAREGSEGLYALDLSRVRVPAALARAVASCRPPRPEELDVLRAWRYAYDVEALGGSDTAEERRRSDSFLESQIADGNAWVALDEGRPVSLSALNAALPDIVQLGGIYTPPELRGRGYAKVSVAAALLAAHQRGAGRAVLFTDNPSAARCYEALGFVGVGDYAHVLFR
jgi:uncharacterized protein